MAGVIIVLLIGAQGLFDIGHRHRIGAGCSTTDHDEAARGSMSVPRHIEWDLFDHQIERTWGLILIHAWKPKLVAKRNSLDGGFTAHAALTGGAAISPRDVPSEVMTS